MRYKSNGSLSLEMRASLIVGQQVKPRVFNIKSKCFISVGAIEMASNKVHVWRTRVTLFDRRRKGQDTGVNASTWVFCLSLMFSVQNKFWQTLQSMWMLKWRQSHMFSRLNKHEQKCWNWMEFSWITWINKIFSVCASVELLFWLNSRWLEPKGFRIACQPSECVSCVSFKQ